MINLSLGKDDYKEIQQKNPNKDYVDNIIYPK